MRFMFRNRVNFGCDMPGSGIRQMNEWVHEEQAERDVIRVIDDVAVCYLLISLANFSKTFEKDQNNE